MKERQVYTDLAAAFGKKGVQALIIHNALPEIEEEANRLLTRNYRSPFVVPDKVV